MKAPAMRVFFWLALAIWATHSGEGRSLDVPHACATGMSDQVCQDAIDRNKEALRRVGEPHD